MASKKRTWPRRTEAADPHQAIRGGDQGDNGYIRAKTCFPPSPRTESETASGDAEHRDDDRLLKYHRPRAIDANDICGDTTEGAPSATNARNSPAGTKRCIIDGHGHTSDTPLRIYVDASSPKGQRIGTSPSATDLHRVGAQSKRGRARERFAPGVKVGGKKGDSGPTREEGTAVAEVAGRAPTSSPRLRHSRDPGSPEIAYRKAVQAYLAPPAKTTYPDAHNGGHKSNNNKNHRRLRSLSPGTAQRSRWCSPIRPPEDPDSGTGVHSSAFACAGAGASTGSSTSAALGEHEGVPPLLLAPAEWGIGLGGEWVSARGPHTIRAVGRVSLTWADIRGNTLLHLAAQHNDVALVQAVLECEKRRKRALEKREGRRERVLERARAWSERNVKETTERKITAKPTTLTTKDILRRIKEEQAEQEKTTADVANDATPAGDNVSGFSAKHASERESPSTDDDVLGCEIWLPLVRKKQPHAAPDGSDGGQLNLTLEGLVGQKGKRTRWTTGGGGGRGGSSSAGGGGCSGDGAGRRGAAIVEALRGVLEEAHVRQVVRLAALYLAANMTEAQWYHRTAVVLPRSSSAGGASDMLVNIAAAHPSDTYRRRMAKAAIQDYAEEERSNAEGGFWKDQGIKDALDLNARNRLSETPLILGAQNTSVEVVAALLEEAGTDIAALNADGCTALVVATMLNNTAVVKVLVAAYVARGLGVDHQTANGSSALHWAVVRGNTDATIDLVDAGAAVNTGRTERRQALWRLPIHKCAEYGSLACLNVLLKAGADPLVEDKLGMTPMHIAAGKGFLEIMQLLSASGEHTAAVSINVVSKKNGRTPLHYAVESLQLEAARYILGRSGDDCDENLDDSAGGREAEGIKLLGANQRTKLQMMLTAAEKEERGVLASSIASLSEFMRKVFL